MASSIYRNVNGRMTGWNQSEKYYRYAEELGSSDHGQSGDGYHGIWSESYDNGVSILYGFWKLSGWGTQSDGTVVSSWASTEQHYDSGNPDACWARVESSPGCESVFSPGGMPISYLFENQILCYYSDSPPLSMTTEPDSYNNAAWNEDGLPQELAKQERPSGMWSLPPENLQRPKPGDKPSSVKDLADELGGLTSEDRKAWGGWVKEGVWVSTKSYAKTLAELAVDYFGGKILDGAGAAIAGVKWLVVGKKVTKAGVEAVEQGAKHAGMS